MTPLVSIIIPTYNRAHLIAETLQSVQQQTYIHWECIVVDDGSTDGTEAVVNTFMRADPRFQYQKRPQDYKKGANGCRNFGYSISQGVYVNWLDSDDLFSSEKIAAQVSVLEDVAIGDKVIVTCKWNRFSGKFERVAPKETHLNRNYESGLELLKDFNKEALFFPSHCYLVARPLVDMAGLWNETLSINQDGEFFTRLLLKTDKVLHSESGMVYYRTTETQRVSNIDAEIKAKSAIKSWMLIEQHLMKKAPDYEFKHLSHAKNYIFYKFYNKAFWDQYPVFFEIQIKRQVWWRRLRRKLKRMFRIH